MLGRLTRTLITLGGWLAWTAILVSLIDFDNRGGLAPIVVIDRAAPAGVAVACTLLALAALFARPIQPLAALFMLLITLSWLPAAGASPLGYSLGAGAWRWIRVIGFAVLTVHLYLRMGATKEQIALATFQAIGREGGRSLGRRWWKGG